MFFIQNKGDRNRSDYTWNCCGKATAALVCPMTNTNKKHPFHIALDGRTQTTDVILCDQKRDICEKLF